MMLSKVGIKTHCGRLLLTWHDFKDGWINEKYDSTGF